MDVEGGEEESWSDGDQSEHEVSWRGAMARDRAKVYKVASWASGQLLYSREDIREQYCVTAKELAVLERKNGKIFGCLSAGHLNHSPCSKKTFLLLSCVQRKTSSELDEDSDVVRRSVDDSFYFSNNFSIL